MTIGVHFSSGDEAPEFAPAVLDCLRQPLESGRIVIHRSKSVATFPARFQLVLAANPCPCGQYGSRDLACTCSPQARRRYLGRLSGPLLDRVDIQLRVARIGSTQFRLADDPALRGVSTAEARARVHEARARAAKRLRDTPWSLNAEVPGRWLRDRAQRLAPDDTVVVDRALESGHLTMRGYDRVLRIAWTLADLESVPRPDASHVAGALALRRSV